MALLVQVCITLRLGSQQLRYLRRTLFFVGLMLVVLLAQHAGEFVKWYCLNGGYCAVPHWLASSDVAISSLAGVLTGVVW